MFDIATPWLLILLPLPWLIHRFWPVAQAKGSMALHIPFYQRLLSLKSLQKTSLPRNSFKTYVAYLIWALLVFAAAGPQWLGKPLELPQSGRSIMLAVDLSGSMRIPDMKLKGHYENRLTVVKDAARKFIKARKGDRLGLILFGSKAYLQTPLTFDLKTVMQMLNDATIGLAGTQTAIGDAIGLAIKRLEKAPGKSRVLILLTDGGNNSGVVTPMDAAKMAAKSGIKIYTIGIGANQLVVPGLFGPQVIHPTSALDEATLKKIAKMTHGLFFRAQNSEDLQRVYTNLNTLIPVVAAKNIFRPITPLYPWPLALALLISVLMILNRLNLFNLNRRERRDTEFVKI